MLIRFVSTPNEVHTESTREKQTDKSTHWQTVYRASPSTGMLKSVVINQKTYVHAYILRTAETREGAQGP